MRTFPPLALIALATLCAGPARAAINPPVGAATPFTPDQRTEVVLYVANETAPDSAEAESYRIIGERLRTSGSVVGPKIAAKNDLDRVLFPDAVDAEIAALSVATGDGGPLSALGVIIASNRLLRHGIVLVHRPGTAGLAQLSFLPTPSDNRVLASNPVSSIETLERLLALTAALFPPSGHVVSLVTKSHGSPTRAMAPNLGAWHSDFTSQELHDSLRGMELGSPATGPTFSPVMPGGVGIGKSEYLAALASAGTRYGVEFALVYMEACRSGLGFADDQELPRNVRRLFTTDHSGSKYRVVPYEQVLTQAGERGSVAVALDDFLASDAQQSLRAAGLVQPDGATRSWWRLASWLALAVAVLALLWRGPGIIGALTAPGARRRPS